jgi:thiol-disulfide isomerase/thioredoxin
MRILLALTIPYLLLISFTINAQHYWPFSQNYSEALIEAQQKDAPLYLHFTASWCMPCVWMVENTYSSEQVLSQLKSLVPVTIDIESNEGKILQKKFQIEILPTLLIVDAASEQVIAKKEKSLSAAELQFWLKETQPATTSSAYFIEIGRYLNLTEAYKAQETLQRVLKEKINLKEIDAFYYLQLGNFSTAETAQNKLSQMLDLGINGQIKSF